MAEESYSFTAARTRLEEIVVQVRKKDTSLEKSLDLLEEGVRLANQCTELIDHADWSVDGVPATEALDPDAEVTEAESEAQPADQDLSEEPVGVAEDSLPPQDMPPIGGEVETAEDPEDVVAVDGTDVFDAAGEFEDADGAWSDVEDEPVGEPSQPADSVADEG